MRPKRRGLVLFSVMAAVAAIVTAGPSPSALGCSCELKTVEQRIEEAASVAVVEATVQIATDDRDIVWEAVPTQVFKGEPPPIVIVNGGTPGSSCSHRVIRAGQLLGVTIRDDGRAWVAGCTSEIPLNTLDALFSAIEQPEGGGPPAYVVGHDRPGARIGLADPTGAMVAFGEERRDVHMISACPGGSTIATLVTGPYPSTDSALVIRDVATLDIIAEHALEVPVTQSFDPPPVVDFECHSADGSEVGYLIPRHKNERARERDPDRAESVVSLWRADAVTEIPAGGAARVAFDLPNDTIYTIADENGSAVERWRASTGTLEATIPLPDLRAVGLIVADTETELIVLAGPPKGRGMYLVEIDGDVANTTDLEEDRRPLAIYLADDGYVTLAKPRGGGAMIQLRGPAMELRHEYTTDYASPPLFAPSSPPAYVDRGSLLILEAPNAVLSSKATRVTAVAALPVVSRDLVVDVDDLEPRFEPNGALPSGVTAAEDDSAAEGESPADSTAPWLVWLGILSVILVAALASVIWSRRRPSAEGWRRPRP